MPYRKSRDWGPSKPPAGTQVARTSLSKGLIAHWPFYEGSGLVASDPAGNNTGAIVAATWKPGRFGPSLNFSTAYVTIPYTSRLNLGNIFSWSCWFNTTSIAATQWLFGFDNNAINAGLEAFLDASGRVKMTLPGNTFASTNPIVAINTWYHCVGTKLGTGANACTIWLNGINQVLSINTAATAIDNAVAHVLGTRRSPSTSPFVGQLDNFAFWNRVLQPWEIMQLYTEPFILLQPPTRRIISGSAAAAARLSYLSILGAG